jgi:oligoribonuclease NrnB/cAMP/cGMP phosphodiesterase (DHH superfamily)
LSPHRHGQGVGPVHRAQRRPNPLLAAKQGGPLDVSQIAAKFGGGGHTMAAGTFLPGPLDNAQKLILAEMTESL